MDLNTEQVENNEKDLTGILETRSASEVERDMLDREQKAINDRVNNMSAADISAIAFNQFYPMFASKVNTLSNKDARRLAIALVQWPLIDENPHFHSQAAKEAFSLGMRLIDAKTIMRDTIEMEYMEKNLDKQPETGDNQVEEILQNVETEFTKEEETNNG